jgi:hypothetical protein
VEGKTLPGRFITMPELYQKLMIDAALARLNDRVPREWRKDVKTQTVD